MTGESLPGQFLPSEENGEQPGLIQFSGWKRLRLFHPDARFSLSKDGGFSEYRKLEGFHQSMHR